MPDITWLPPEAKPKNAEEIEAAIDRVARGGVVRLSLTSGGWRVRALLPAAMCARGAPASERDVSSRVVEVLLDHDCAVADVKSGA
jgi:hypothetical protein